VLELQNIYVEYGEIHALEDISFKVEEGDFVGVIGPNGAGKTTLLRVVLGLIENCTGTIKFYGRHVHDKHVHGVDDVSSEVVHRNRTELRLGYVPQNASLQIQNFPATVLEVAHTGRVSKRTLFKRYGKDDHAQVENVLKMVGMYDLRNRKIGELSGGQLQRVFIARALASEPQLLILDEPTSGVDAPSQAKFYELLTSLNKEQGLTLMLSTHDISAISRLCSKVVCINKTIFYHGDPKDFFSGDQMAKAYGYPIKLVMREDHSV
jgi:zinc transport system ATP-binding protein